MLETRGRATGGMGVERQGTRNAESRTWKLPEAREPDTWKLVRPVCAVRRVVISLPEAGGMREEIPGLLAYLEAKAEGDQACQASGAYSKVL
jgi:hypothetical protein